MSKSLVEDFLSRFFWMPPTRRGEGAPEKLFETKTLVLVFKVDFNPNPWFGVEKLRTIKTARFSGRVLFGCESYRFTSEKLLDDKIFIFWW